jgi:hypothetical protein
MGKENPSFSISQKEERKKDLSGPGRTYGKRNSDRFPG